MGVAAAFGRVGGRSPRDGDSGVRRAAVVIFFASVSVNAVLGIAALLVGEFSGLHGRILGTSLSVTGALLLALACLPAWERRRLGPLPPIGVGLAAVAFGFVVVMIWAGSESETLGKLTGTWTAAAVACAATCVLAYPALAPRFQPVLIAALASTALAAAMVIAGIWLQPESSWYSRALGAVVVLLTSLAVSIPVLHRISGSRVAGGSAATGFCPFCGAEHRAAMSQRTVCGHCGEAFRIGRG